MATEKKYWENKTLTEMSQSEWESLCDGCGYCCLVKLEDEDEPGAIYTTNISCRLLDTDTCCCTDYPNRISKVPSCIVIEVNKPEVFDLLPETCAYRLINEGNTLYDWHPLISKDKSSVRMAGVSVCVNSISEEYVHPDEFEDHILHRLK